MNARSRFRLIAAGAIGNVLEWYDFAIYGYFAASIGRTFFPEGRSGRAGPGGLRRLRRRLFDAAAGRHADRHIGDRYGRRAALTFSVTAMAVPTFLVGVLPGYATLGVAAPILLTLLRMIQGLSVGGEYTTSIVFMVEHAPPGRRGLIGAMAVCGAVGRHPAGVGDRRADGHRFCRPTPCTTGAGACRSCSACWSASPATCCGARSRTMNAANPWRSFAAASRRSATQAVAAAAGRPLGVQRRRLLPDVRLHRELAAARRRHGAGTRARHQHRQHGRAAAGDAGHGLAVATGSAASRCCLPPRRSASSAPCRCSG